MEKINWIHIASALVSGGAMGAFINQLFYWRRTRIQSIGKNIEIKPLFNKSHDNTILNTKIIVEDTNNQKFEFDNLWIASIVIANNGNTDYAEFELGINLKDKVKAVRAISPNANRHHQINFKNEPKLNQALQEIDFAIKPLNRKQVYEIDLFLTSENKEITEKDIELISPHSINFVQIKDFAESVGEIIGGVSISLFGNTITINRKE
jgi:hypothetical protein